MPAANKKLKSDLLWYKSNIPYLFEYLACNILIAHHKILAQFYVKYCNIFSVFYYIINKNYMHRTVPQETLFFKKLAA